MRIADSSIGGGAPVYVIAEAGVNHNGDPLLAHRLVDAAAAAGADAIKFQTFRPEALAAPAAPRARYQIAQTGSATDQLTMLRELQLEHEAYPGLIEHARDAGLAFLSTPFDAESVEFLRRLELPAFKLASPDLVNDPLLRQVAATGLPLVMSTGMADLDECGRALEVAKAAGATEIALLHCVSEYPAPPGDCNLRALDTLRSRFAVPVGWSDHTEGAAVALAAVARGADVLEKHLTLDRSLPGPDHAASLEPADFAELVRGVRDVEAALGDGTKVPTEGERRMRAVVRRSVHYARDLRAGSRIGEADLVMLRPGTGLAPAEADTVTGRVVTRDVHAGAAVALADLEDP